MAGVALAPDLLEMIARGVSANVASRDAALRPSVMRAIGTDISADGGSVTVYLARTQSRQLIQDIASTGHVAVVFSEPATHRTVQLKAASASLRDATEADRCVLARYLASMEHELARIGYPADIPRALLAYRLDDVVAVSFRPEQGFDQTPGPQAGRTLGGAP